MSPSPQNHPSQPRLPDLLARLLSRQAAERAEGFAEPNPSEVELHDASPAPPCDPRTAWAEAGVALKVLVPSGVELPRPPAEWSALVPGLATVAALPMAAGHFPQLVREVVPLMKPGRKRDLLRTPLAVDASRAASTAEQALRKGQTAQALVAIGLLRLAGDANRAGRLLSDVTAAGPWRDALRNEEAATAWCAGRYEDAEAIWASMPVSAPVLFNRGVAALFLDRPKDARTILGKAAEALPDDGPWQHLAHLYLAVTEM